MITLAPGPRKLRVVAPPSKSLTHRLLIANFLAGDRDCLRPEIGDSSDVLATRRCLTALAEPLSEPVLDCGESGSTLRFLAPVAAALGKRPRFLRQGRLAERPFVAYPDIRSGCHRLPGDVSSQLVSGLLFALPLLAGDSRIELLSPLESRGYVELTLQVLQGAGIVIDESSGFHIPGGQRFRPQPMAVEGDWSAAAFWYAMNALGSKIVIEGLDSKSVQPDRAIETLACALPARIDVSPFPDLFPVLSVIAAFTPRRTDFVGIARLRLKECDRIEAMREVVSKIGAEVEVSAERFTVLRGVESFPGGEFTAFGDHRVAMSVAVAATRSSASVVLDDEHCVDKSYPGFFEIFRSEAGFTASALTQVGVDATMA